MATNFTLLDAPKLLETTTVLIGEKVPNTQRFIITHLWCANQSSSAANLTVYLVSSGNPDGNDIIVGAEEIAANTSRAFTVGPLPMPKGYGLYAKASATSALTLVVPIRKENA